MDKDNEQVDVDLDLDETEEETPEEPGQTTDWEARAKRLEEKAIAQRERTRLLKAEMAKLKKAQEKKDEPKTGELGDSDLNYLDLKGVTEEEDIDIIQKFMAKTGQTVRQALKDDYVQTKLKGLQAKRDVENATPSGTKRSGNQANDLATAQAKFEQTGELPGDFELRTQVLNKLAENKSSIPPWRR